MLCVAMKTNRNVYNMTWQKRLQSVDKISVEDACGTVENSGIRMLIRVDSLRGITRRIV